jgi:circadian clock protein KaiB
VVHLKLFVSGRSDLSERAQSNAHTFCSSNFGSAYRLDIVDVIAQPQVADEEGVVTTPTLIRYQPAPPRRIIGDLSDHRRVARALGLRAPVAAAI